MFGMLGLLVGIVGSDLYIAFLCDEYLRLVTTLFFHSSLVFAEGFTLTLGQIALFLCGFLVL